MGRNRREFKVATNVVFTGIADKGKCVGKTQDGQVVFAEGAAPGDVADVLVRPKKVFLKAGYNKYTLMPRTGPNRFAGILRSAAGAAGSTSPMMPN